MNPQAVSYQIDDGEREEDRKKHDGEQQASHTSATFGKAMKGRNGKQAGYIVPKTI